MTVIGANPEHLDHLASVFSKASSGVVNSRSKVTNELYVATWLGADADSFRDVWHSISSPKLTNLAAVLDDLANLLRQHAQEQRSASQADGQQMMPYPLTPFLPTPPSVPVASSGTDIGSDLDLDWSVLLDVWKATKPALAILKGWKMLQYGLGNSQVLPVLLNNPIIRSGVIGKYLLGIPKLGPWLLNPGVARGVGIAGGVLITGLGLYNLFQQGNPVDAFKRDPGAYVSDVASTAFSGAATAFLIYPNPVTGAIALGTAVVWAGTEVWDHWDAISTGASKAWDATTDAVGDAWDAGTDYVTDAFDSAGNVASSVADKLSFWN